MALSAISSAARNLDQVLQHQHFNVENREEVESLFNEVTSLHGILENSINSPKNSKHIASLALERKMVYAAKKVRDLTETHVGKQIIRGNYSISSSRRQLLEEAKREVDVIVQALGLVEIGADAVDPYDHEAVNSKLYDRTSSTVVIVGTAGIGKTALARRVFNDFVEEELQIRAWVDVSKSYYDVKQILIDVVHSLGNFPVKEMHEKTAQELRQYLYSRLQHMSYLIVLDGLLHIRDLQYLIKILPDTRRYILATTRLEVEDLALYEQFLDIHIHHLPTIQRQIFNSRPLIRNITIEAEALLKKFSLLHGVLHENSLEKSTKETKSLENQIVNVEKIAKAFIDLRIIKYNWTFSPECLAEVKREIGLVKKLITKLDTEEETQNLHCLPGAASSIPVAPVGNIIVDDFTKIKNKLVEGSPQLEIVHPDGMNGIGKTTLAKQVYNDKDVTRYFDVRAWVTIFQFYDQQKVLEDLLDSMENDSTVKVDKKSTVGDLLECVYKKLKGRKYLIVIDCVWDTEVWDVLKKRIPHDRCSSRIILTTTLVDISYFNIHHRTIRWENLHYQHLMRNTRIEAEFLLIKVSLLHGVILKNSSGKSTQERKSLENQIINVETRVKAFTESYFMEYNLTFSPECLAEVKREIGLVKKLITEIVNEEETQNLHCLPGAASSIPDAPVDNIIVEDVTEIKDKLAEGSSKLEIVCLVGMGGIGKTTLAK